ncbi:MAG: hypothetical protein WAM42_10760 [Candidatus Nitrosopolaris sp.]
MQDPRDVIKDPQLSENGIVVPLADAGGNLKSTISSPMEIKRKLFNTGYNNV